MKCPLDKTEMEKGALSENGTAWYSGIMAKIGTLVSGLGYTMVVAYKCPECGKIELATKDFEGEK